MEDLRDFCLNKMGVLDMYSRFGKRLFDVLFSGCILVAVFPILLLVYILIKMFMKGDALFVQRRVGLDGKFFRLFKFRTMVQDARFARNGLEVLEGDKRVTFIGKYLRKSSLDELPQLLNVFIGDLSIVGPRPALPEQVRYYSENQLQRFKVKPGITGLATINGRCAIPWSERIEFDIKYISNINFSNDVKIILKTALVVIGGKNTYFDSANGHAFDLSAANDLPQAESLNEEKLT